MLGPNRLQPFMRLLCDEDNNEAEDEEEEARREPMSARAEREVTRPSGIMVGMEEDCVRLTRCAKGPHPLWV